MVFLKNQLRCKTVRITSISLIPTNGTTSPAERAQIHASPLNASAEQLKGLPTALVQIFLPGPAAKLFGERWAVVVGIACACVALVVMAFANQGWMVFAIMPIFALAGIGSPAFQALATRQVDQARQGQLQGVLTSAISLASVISPLAFSTFYFVVQKQWPGAIWLSVIAIYAVAVPLVLLGTRAAQSAQPVNA